MEKRLAEIIRKEVNRLTELQANIRYTRNELQAFEEQEREQQKLVEVLEVMKNDFAI